MSIELLQNVPDELKAYHHWVVWRYEDKGGPKPTKVPYNPKTAKHADVTDSETWGTFVEACNAYKSGMYAGTGFVLSEEDPFAFIDLDDTEGDNDKLARQRAIFSEFESYAELSPSGKGLHIIVKGAVHRGRKRDRIEIYSSDRYMTMTGNVFRAMPVVEHNEKLNALWHQMSAGPSVDMFYAGLDSARYTDEEVHKQAADAKNGEKFLRLFSGDWQTDYSSNSEADFALVDIIAFYSKNAEQVTRMFYQSGLGKRDKVQRAGYVGYMLNRCFDTLLPPVDIDGLRIKIEDALAQKQNVSDMPPPIEAPILPSVAPVELTNEAIEVPPGLVGDIARYIYSQAPRPVPQIALAGALGFMAGIVGRSHNISATGLNQYILLLAATGTGKEAISSGISKLVSAVAEKMPNIQDFYGPDEISSPQALARHLSDTSRSFFCIVGEFGLKLAEMSSANAALHTAGVRRILLHIYNKSGEGNLLPGSIYSKKENNVGGVKAPAVTIIGESTPERFYQVLTDDMIYEGLLPRFTIIEYKGERPPRNEAHAQAFPPFDLVDKLQRLISTVIMLNSSDKAVHVATDTQAKAAFDSFDMFVDKAIKGRAEVYKSLWTRAHVKALKLAGLIAVGVNPISPVVDIHTANWAINMVRRDTETLLSRFESGEVGANNEETQQVKKMLDVIKDFIVKPISDVTKYDESCGAMHADKVIPYAYIQRRLASTAAFRKDRMGSTAALKRTAQTLIERGDIQEIGRSDMQKRFNTGARAFCIGDTKRMFG